MKRFEKQGIYLTLIHSNSYSSLKDATNNFPHGVGNFFMRRLPAKFLNFCFNHCGLEFNSREIIENTKCPVLIVGRKGDTVIPQEAQLVGKLPDSSTPDTSERFRWNIVLEHDPQNTECKSKNIHTDYKEHLVYHEDNGSIKKYEEKENKFIEEAHEYLIDSEFNKNFDLGQYRISNFSGNLTKIELELINEEYMRV